MNTMLKNSNARTHMQQGPHKETFEDQTQSGNQRKKVRTFSATNQEVQMLDALAAYHGFSKSAMITSLVKKEFWRVFPSGTQGIQANQDAWIRSQRT